MADYKKVQIVDSNGNLLDEVSVKDEVARNGLAGKVSKSGDTMTGDLVIQSTSTSNKVLRFVPGDTSKMSLAQIAVRNDERLMFWHRTSNNNGNELYMLPAMNTSATGNNYYDILTSKTPVTVAQGGTGGTDSGWLQLTNPSVITGAILYRKIGVFVQVVVSIYVTTDIAARTLRELATLPSGYRPTLPGGCTIAGFAGNANIQGVVTISSAGVVGFTPSEAWSASQVIRGSIMYLI